MSDYELADGRVRARMEGLRQHLGSARVPLGAGGRAMLSRLAGACEIELEVCKFQREACAGLGVQAVGGLWCGGSGGSSGA